MTAANPLRTTTSSALLALIVAVPSLARAAGTDAAAAEVLFRDGKQLMANGDFDRACPKLAESYRLDPATGALLATALCYERAGKLATAWVTYTQAASRAKAEHSPDREQSARSKANELEGKLDKLVVDVASGNPPEILVTRDGVTIGEAEWGVAIPVDAGTHVVEATAAGKTSFRTEVIARGAATSRVTIPVLADAAPGAAAAPPDSEARPAPAREEPAKQGAPFWTPLRIAGATTAGLGIVAVGVGTVFGFRALSLNSDSNANGHCDANDHCDATGVELRNDARDAGTISTIAMASGAALLVGGITLFAVGAPSSESVSVSVRPGSLVLGGRF
ncbi:MAG TPA: hypothetical protein VFV94_12485 [Polyangiaceae bacterium]|nr:hypothetical protein [Polyangiaceae bacterium]